MTLWFTGLPGAGKSTLAKGVAEKLLDCGVRVEVLDGDVIRQVLSSNLGYNKQDRDVNIRRIGFLSHLLSRNGIVAIVAAISPYRAIREEVRRNHGGILFVEIFVDCPLEVLVGRDTKGLYQRALRGEIQNFTGVSDPYETPENPEIIVHTDRQTPDESVSQIFEALRKMPVPCELPEGK
jgi:adenylylsulfate kinase